MFLPIDFLTTFFVVKGTREGTMISDDRKCGLGLISRFSILTGLLSDCWVKISNSVYDDVTIEFFCINDGCL